jgi:hypothetical protein
VQVVVRRIDGLWLKGRWRRLVEEEVGDVREQDRE